MDNIERFRQAKEIFFAALDLPPIERSAFLAEKCAGNAELFAEIEAIFASHEEAGDFIENSAFDSVSSFVLDERDLKLSGTQIGAYRVVRELGKGGMGAVYLCERTAEFHKQVAVKLIKRGLDTDDIIRRFERERQILAALDHPHIARLIDGGATSDGLPYLVMDYVEGASVTEYCAEHNLTTEEILKLFQKICAAIAYAHRNLIVHRDIKPTNILVTKDGTPKLLDFGIAKLLAESENEPLSVLTQTRQAMTPEYASPEQLNGERVTTATDIFSLGVVLYELLTGARPSPVGSSPSFEKVSSPSKNQRTKDKKTKYPKGDLGKILAMALREEPERRYSSVDQFAADIKRFLAGLPVIAQADSFSYRAEKFIRRNKVPVAAGIGVFASLVAGIAATSRQARIARRQRDKSQKVSDFLKRILSSADPREQSKDIKVIKLLGEAAKSIEDDFANEPDVAADLHATIGLTYLSLGILSSAENHLKTALDVRLAHFPRQSIEVATSLNHYGKLTQEKGDVTAAEPFFREAFEILRRLRREQSLEFAEVLRNYAYMLCLKGELEKAFPLHRQELAIRRQIQGENHIEVARTLTELGDVARNTGDFVLAESLHHRSLKILQKNYGAEHPDIALVLFNLGDSIYTRKPCEAETLYRQSLAMRRKLLGEDHAETAWTLYKLAYVLYNREKYVEAESYLRDILAKRGASLPASHLVISSSYVLLGWALMRRKKFAAAKSAIEECLNLRRQTLPEDHWMIAMPNVFLGECLIYLGEVEIGKRLLLKNYEILKEKLGEHHELTQTAREKIAKFF